MVNHRREFYMKLIARVMPKRRSGLVGLIKYRKIKSLTEIARRVCVTAQPLDSTTGMILRMKASNSGTVNAVSPCAGL